MKHSSRFVTIDFLRGLAIWIMVFLHTILRVYDWRWIDDPNILVEVRVIMLVLLIIVMFFGGWCGFFLLMSSIGNMISMQKALERGDSVKSIVLKQVIGGFILLFFGMLCESITGYYSWLGQLPFGIARPIMTYLPYIYHFETIHAVAWCVIVNGIVHGLLAWRKGYQNIIRNIKIYGLLAIFVVILTKPVWMFTDWIIPGYPFAIPPGSVYMVQYPIFGETSFGKFILLFFFMPLHGHPEPLFPFLAVSFIGSLIGLYLISPNPTNRGLFLGMLISTVLMVVGLGGTVLSMDIFGGPQSFDQFILNTWNIPRLDHVWWVWFLFLTGFQVFVTLILLRIIEFRGKSAEFAKSTLYFRRFGFIPFTIYNLQWFDFIPRALFTVITGIDVLRSGVNGNLTMLMVGLVLLTWLIIMWLWERIHYIGTLEWIISRLSQWILPKKRSSLGSSSLESQSQQKTPWWRQDRLNIEGILHHAKWINIIPSDQKPKDQIPDSKLALKLGFIGFAWIVFSIVGLVMAIGTLKSEGKNRYNRWAILIGIAGILFFIGFYVTLILLKGISI